MWHDIVLWNHAGIADGPSLLVSLLHENQNNSNINKQFSSTQIPSLSLPTQRKTKSILVSFCDAFSQKQMSALQSTLTVVCQSITGNTNLTLRK